MSGNPVPGTFAKDDEVLAIAGAVHQAGGAGTGPSISWALPEEEEERHCLLEQENPCLSLTCCCPVEESRF